MNVLHALKGVSLLATLGAASAIAQPPVHEANRSTIGYPTVAAAEADLRSKSGVVFADKSGWKVASDEATYTIWSFVPSQHPAYPSVIKRQIVSNGSGQDMDMNILCEASKSACDDLVRTFDELNGRARASLRGR